MAFYNGKLPLFLIITTLILIIAFSVQSFTQLEARALTSTTTQNTFNFPSSSMIVGFIIVIVILIFIKRRNGLKGYAGAIALSLAVAGLLIAVTPVNHTYIEESASYTTTFVTTMRTIITRTFSSTLTTAATGIMNITTVVSTPLPQHIWLSPLLFALAVVVGTTSFLKERSKADGEAAKKE